MRAANPLAVAGERAFARGDMPAAVNLLSRATALLPSHDPRRLELLPELAFALMETADFDRLVAVTREMDEAADRDGRCRTAGARDVIGLWIRMFTSPEGWAAEAEREAKRAIETFHGLRDERGLARAWSLLGLVQLMYARFAPAEEAWSRAVEHAERAEPPRAFEGLSWVPLTVASGPTPADEGIRRCREILDRAQGDRKAMSSALFSEAGFEAGLGHFGEARELWAGQSPARGGRASGMGVGPPGTGIGWIELLGGEPAAAEQELRRGYETLSAIGEVSCLSTVAGILAEAIYAQGRYEEAEGSRGSARRPRRRRRVLARAVAKRTSQVPRAAGRGREARGLPATPPSSCERPTRSTSSGTRSCAGARSSGAGGPARRSPPCDRRSGWPSARAPWLLPNSAVKCSMGVHTSLDDTSSHDICQVAMSEATYYVLAALLTAGCTATGP